MALDATKPDLVVGVVGTGAMGRGIVQVSAQGGMRVVCYDAQPGAAEAAKASIAKVLASLVAKGRVAQSDADGAVSRITVADTLAEVAKADVVVEAVIERLDVKQALFAELDAMAGPDTILATNTSSLPVTAIAAKCANPERVAGLHFFNPVPLMRLVEVIPGLKSRPDVADALMSIGRRMTREPILCTDSPGFIVNHVGRAYVPEASRLVAEGIAAFDDIDRIMTGAPGFRMGPFQLIDLTGADVSVPVMESILGQFYCDPLYAPQPLLKTRVDAGMFGQKTGAGWYTYVDGKRQDVAPRPAPQGLPRRSVWVRPSEHAPEASDAVRSLLAASGVALETGGSPSADAVILLTPVGWDLTTAIVDLHLDPARTVAVDALFGLKSARTLMVSPATAPEFRDAAHAMLAADGAAAAVINDSPGFVAQRIVAHIINTCCHIAQRQIATPEDIDKGAMLGLSYPFGPLAWGDAIGPQRVLHILERLQSFYGEPRYRPSSWLKRRAALGLSLLTPDRRS